MNSRGTSVYAAVREAAAAAGEAARPGACEVCGRLDSPPYVFA